MGNKTTKKNKHKNSAQQPSNSNTNNKKSSSDDENVSLAKKADSMQLVADSIYMGSAVAAKQRQVLLKNGVTHILAIGWNLEKYFEEDFEYLLLNNIEDRPSFIILNLLPECFEFIDNALNIQNGTLFVHCHKGLSRSATIIIAYEMFKQKASFETVLEQIRVSRSFVMPNIGFQSQLKLFHEKNYSLDMQDYSHLDLDIIGKISQALPQMKVSIAKFYSLFENEKHDEINDQELFGLTMYVHQVQMLHSHRKIKSEQDIQMLQQCIQILRNIQTDFIDDEVSLARFDAMFKTKYHQPANNNSKKNNSNNSNPKK